MKKTIGLFLFVAGVICHAGPLNHTQSDACLGAGNCSVALTGTLTGSGTDYNTYFQTVQSFFGKLEAAAHSDFSVTNTWALSVAGASFTEDFIVHSASHPDGTTGMFAMGYSIDGTNSASGIAHSFVQVGIKEVDINNPSTVIASVSHDYSGASINQSVMTPAIFPIIYGQKFEMLVFMQATAGSIIDIGVGYQLKDVTGSGVGTSTFDHTLVINSLQTGDNASDLTIESGSGTTYSQAGIVPEPSTLALGGLALLGFGIAVRRSSRILN